jgi:hypothetical protein
MFEEYVASREWSSVVVAPLEVENDFLRTIKRKI